MKYERIKKAAFLSRQNRFVAHVMSEGQEVICHVKNTGRCRELLIPGAEVFIQESDNPNRKTRYDLIGVKKGNLLINMDSQAPNQVVKEWLSEGNLFGQESKIRPEKKYGNSRFDFYVEAGERKAFIEVKGVTLEENGVARFPDAPTERGIKHIEELISCMEEGYEAYMIFVIQMKGIHLFEPNDGTHAAFGEALRKAWRAGVQVLAYDCTVTEDTLALDLPVPVHL